MRFIPVELKHIITRTFGCANGKMHVDSVSDVQLFQSQNKWSILRCSLLEIFILVLTSKEAAHISDFGCIFAMGYSLVITN